MITLILQEIKFIVSAKEGSNNTIVYLNTTRKCYAILNTWRHSLSIFSLFLSLKTCSTYHINRMLYIVSGLARYCKNRYRLNILVRKTSVYNLLYDS